MKRDVYSRFEDYKKDHCWQYEMRQQNLANDLKEANLTEDEYLLLTVDDFIFSYVDKEDIEQCIEIKQFIQRHEWLGNLPNRPTHRFTARLKCNNALAGVIIMAIPNSFSHLLGKENATLERLISRGACISWGPKHLGSWLVMKSIRWMVKNTEFRIFSAYSDPEAKELGTIYQACNFIYLGQTSGTPKQYYDNGYFNGKKKGWFSDREFRKKSMFMKYAKLIEPEFYHQVGFDDYKDKMFGFISWEKAKHIEGSLALRWKPNWEIMEKKYPGLKERLKKEEDKYRQTCECRETKPKHKYIYLLGSSKKETKELRNKFKELNKNMVNLPYPGNRGK